MFVIFATHLNSAIDPLIYAYRMKEIRDVVEGIFNRTRNQNDVSVVTSTGNHNDEF
jgi:hypothetical protein